MQTELHSEATSDAGMRSLPVTGCVKNVISVDVEDYFHAEAFADIVARSQWSTYPSRVESNTNRLLELFAELNVEATFFILGWVAERYPHLIRGIADAGHELACHSYWHRLIYRMEPNEFREDTHRAKETIEQIAGLQIYGYRAPTYSITTSSLWATEILAELGFTYDSSVFPIRHDRYGIPDAPRFPFRINTASGVLLECPIATFRVCGQFNFPFGGGGYLRLLPWWYTRLGLRQAQAERMPVISYVHPWEVDADQPRLNGRWSSRVRHYTNLDKTCARLATMLGGGAFTSFRNSGITRFEWALNPSMGETNGSR